MILPSNAKVEESVAVTVDIDPDLEEDLRKQADASLPFDDRAAEEYGRLRAVLEQAGTPIGPNDLLIASICLANRLVGVTHNTNEFGRVPGLVIEDWEV